MVGCLALCYGLHGAARRRSLAKQSPPPQSEATILLASVGVHAIGRLLAVLDEAEEAGGQRGDRRDVKLVALPVHHRVHRARGDVVAARAGERPLVDVDARAHGVAKWLVSTVCSMSASMSLV